VTNAIVVCACRTPAGRHQLTREDSGASGASSSISHRSHTRAGFPLPGTGSVFYSVGGWARD
jgi:hypothetical protein